MTTKEEKQQYLRESIIHDKLDTDSFINFMEDDPERGADLDLWEMDELKQKVKEFKDTYQERKGLNQKGDLIQKQEPEKSHKGVESEDEDGNKKKEVPPVMTGGEGEDEPDKDSKYYGRKDCIKL